jgi:hypothetical protein
MASRPARQNPRGLRTAIISCAVGVSAAVCACSSSNPPPSGPASLTCSSPGEATPGPADTHCVGQLQQVYEASCYVDAAGPTSGDVAEASGDAAEPSAEGGEDSGASGDDSGGGAASECDYGATMFGPGSDGGGPKVVEGDDDDCKYHVSWTSTPICKSPTLGVTFTVTVTYLGTGLPVTNIPPSEGILVEAFIPTSLDASCDDTTTHASLTLFAPGSGLLQTSSTSGVYVGSVIFDQSGEWTVRFHIHEECDDTLDSSPHGHAAFHVTVP